MSTLALPLPTRLRSGELKKHVGAIHAKASLSLLERKVANVLLLFAYEELADQNIFAHEIPISTLGRAAGFDSNDTAQIRDALTNLVKHTVQWNILDSKGREEWGVSTFLAQAVTVDGVCTYAYAPELRKRLYNPDVYARINLQVQERFRSSYALALYENTVRFRKVGTTGPRTVAVWRDLLGVDEDAYSQFKYFNRAVLKRAIGEVNRESDITLTMHTERNGKTVERIRFDVAENAQLRLDVEDNVQAANEALRPRAVPDPRALAPTATDLLGDDELRMLTFGLTEADAIDVATAYDWPRIEANLQHVEEELAAQRPIRNVRAYTLAAIRDDYASANERAQKLHERLTPKATPSPSKQDAERRRAAEDERTARLKAQWAALDPVEQAATTARALDALRAEAPSVFGEYANALTRGLAEEQMSPLIRGALLAYRYDAIDATPVAADNLSQTP